MNISSMLQRINLIVFMIGVCSSLLHVCSAQIPVISNVRFETKDSIIAVTFDIGIKGKNHENFTNHPLDRTYRTSITIKKESDPEFEFHPKAILGDIDIDSTGTGKVIAWQILDDLPEGIDAGDCFIEIALQPDDQPSGSSLLWYGAGALVTAAGITAYLFSSPHAIEGPESGGKFPLPPGRPH